MCVKLKEPKRNARLVCCSQEGPIPLVSAGLVLGCVLVSGCDLGFLCVLERLGKVWFGGFRRFIMWFWVLSFTVTLFWVVLVFSTVCSSARAKSGLIAL